MNFTISSPEQVAADAIAKFRKELAAIIRENASWNKIADALDPIVYKPCPFCKKTPVLFSNGMLSCQTDGCFIKGVFILPEAWDKQ